MKCPVCNNEMENGKSIFTSMQGFGQMILSFTSDEEEKKDYLKDNRTIKLLCQEQKLNRIIVQSVNLSLRLQKNPRDPPAHAAGGSPLRAPRPLRPSSF